MGEITAPAIYKAISGVIADVGAVAKDKVNKQQGFKFRSIDDVYNALHPALAKNKVFIVPDILEQTRTIKTTKNGTEMISVICKIRFTFFAEDGSFVESTIIGEGLDTGDKATNKAMAIAYKYACFQVFCIPTEEMVDPDSESPELAERKKKVTKSKVDDHGKKEENKTQGSNAVKADEDMTAPATADMIRTLERELQRTGVPRETLLNLFKVKDLEEMTVIMFKKAMKKFEATPDLKESKDE